MADPAFARPVLEQRSGDVGIHQTSVNVWEQHPNEQALLAVLQGEVERMRRRGWDWHHDEETKRRYPTLAPMHWRGRYGDLEAKMSVGWRHFEIKFFQNLVSENRNGGEYDFDQIGKMTAASRALRLLCITEMHALVQSLCAVGYRLTAKSGFGASEVTPSLLVVRDMAEGRHRGTPLGRFNEAWGPDRFARDESGWPASSETKSWPNHDMAGTVLTQGATRYVRGRDGRMRRGQVFGGINGGWWLVSNGDVIGWHHHAREFFQCTRPEIEPRRIKDHVGRLKQELDKAVKAELYGRVAAIGAVLAREAARG